MIPVSLVLLYPTLPCSLLEDYCRRCSESPHMTCSTEDVFLKQRIVRKDCWKTSMFFEEVQLMREVVYLWIF